MRIEQNYPGRNGYDEVISGIRSDDRPPMKEGAIHIIQEQRWSLMKNYRN